LAGKSHEIRQYEQSKVALNGLTVNLHESTQLQFRYVHLESKKLLVQDAV